MKKFIAIIGAATIALSMSANADSPNWPRAPHTTIKTEKEAKECCEKQQKVALACKECKTLNAQSDKKTVLGWFKANSNHDCSGCKGTITVKAVGGGKVTDTQYRHECSKCGKDSAFTCALHKS